jgi:hypothetical protein
MVAIVIALERSPFMMTMDKSDEGRDLEYSAAMNNNA